MNLKLMPRSKIKAKSTKFNTLWTFWAKQECSVKKIMPPEKRTYWTKMSILCHFVRKLKSLTSFKPRLSRTSFSIDGTPTQRISIWWDCSSPRPTSFLWFFMYLKDIFYQMGSIKENTLSSWTSDLFTQLDTNAFRPIKQVSLSTCQQIKSMWSTTSVESPMQSVNTYMDQKSSFANA